MQVGAGSGPASTFLFRIAAIEKEPTLPEILIETGLFNYEEEEVQELVRELQQLGPEYEVRRVYTYSPHQAAGGGFPVIEALDIWIPWGHIAGVQQPQPRK